MEKKPRDIIILHMCTINESYHVWFLRYGVPTDKIFCHFGQFIVFLPSKNLKNQNFEKMEKLPGDIIILHRYNINDNHMMYGS